MFFNTVNFADIFGTYVFAVREGHFWMIVALLTALAVYVPYAANKVQPTPDVQKWAFAESTRKAKGRR